MWQDWIIVAAQGVFVFSLLPSIFSATKKPTVATSALSAVGVAMLGVAYFSLELWSSTAVSILLTGEWLVLAYQRYRLDQRQKT